MLAGAFLTDFCLLVDRWAEWATTHVEQWPDDPGLATPDPAALQAIAARADW
jgi:hypothetical protein